MIMDSPLRPPSPPPDRWLHRYAVAVVGATVLLVTAGGLVTSTGSGLAVPDWPLSYGMVFPPMVGGILYEHGHRMVAAAVGLLTIGLAGWLARREPRRWVRRLGLAALGAVVAQGLLGGITVLLLLPHPVSIAHACLAQTFLCLVVTIAVVTSGSWMAAGGRRPAPPSRLPALAALTTAAVFAQLILGAVVRHTGSGLAIPDFPLALGRLVPPLASTAVAVHFAHRVAALVVAALVAATAVQALGHHRRERALAGPALLLAALAGLQILLGALAVWTRLAVVPATAHVTTGAVLLGTSLTLALMARRLVARPGRAAAQPYLAASQPAAG
jgi:cytochrome c oxidase assembly protein subunit 15